MGKGRAGGAGRGPRGRVAASEKLGTRSRVRSSRRPRPGSQSSAQGTSEPRARAPGSPRNANKKKASFSSLRAVGEGWARKSSTSARKSSCQALAGRLPAMSVKNRNMLPQRFAACSANVKSPGSPKHGSCVRWHHGLTTFGWQKPH